MLIVLLCYTVEDIVEALRFFYNQGAGVQSRNRLLGGEVRSKYIEPVTKKGIKQFLRLDSNIRNSQLQRHKVLKN